MFTTAETACKKNNLIKQACFDYLRPSRNSTQLIFNINAAVLMAIICLGLRGL